MARRLRHVSNRALAGARRWRGHVFIRRPRRCTAAASRSGSAAGWGDVARDLAEIRRSRSPQIDGPHCIALPSIGRRRKILRQSRRRRYLIISQAQLINLSSPTVPTALLLLRLSSSAAALPRFTAALPIPVRQGRCARPGCS